MNIVWFRRDLRIEDNPALFYATQNKLPVTAVFLATPNTWRAHSMGAPQVAWLHENLKRLEDELRLLGISLIYKQCDSFESSADALLTICKTSAATALYVNNEYEWNERQRDTNVYHTLTENGITYHAFDEQSLIPPHVIKNQKGLPYCVFTPFKKACLLHLQMNPILLELLPKPKPYQSFTPTSSDAKINVHSTITTMITPGETAGHARLDAFVAKQVTHYNEARDIPSLDGTSMLSAYLALGILSVRQCVAALIDFFHGNMDALLSNKGAATWLSELLWRDFYRMICFNFPAVSRSMPFKKDTNQLKWSDNESHFNAWATGKTGVPIIDSAMRQLNTTGWMHNRLRMITAMYLTKNLWQDWRKGEAYFASKLIDWDFASNNGGWQWCASTGTDAAPYFRVFNPITQSERFDPQGTFIRHFCPELASLDNKTIHDPFAKQNQVIHYPRQIVDLKKTRKHAIEQFSALKGQQC